MKNLKLTKGKLLGLIMIMFCSTLLAQITVTSPAGGASITQCSSYIIRFTSPQYVSIGRAEIYKDGLLVYTYGGSSFYQSSDNNIGLPSLLPGDNYQIKVYDYTNQTNLGWSGSFSIQALAAPTATAATSMGQSQFTANWNAVSGATGYRIDVSTNSDFSTFVPSYNNLNTNSLTGGPTSKAIYSSILPGTIYYYRLRTVKNTCTSSNSNSITVLTKPGSPILTLPTEVSNKTTPSSFTVNWNSVQSASEYWIDVSTSSTFSSYVYHDVVSYTNSYSVTGLSPNITHYVRVRAKNSSGLSAYSSTFTVSPINVPVTSAATYVGSTGFHANWYSPTGNWHYLDLSTSSTFSSFVPGYNNYQIQPSTYLIVSGLQPNTIYYYRVRSETASGISVSSNVTSQITLPAPVLTASEISLTSFSLSWSAVTGATEYEIDVSSSSSFATYTTDVVMSTSFNKTGLSSGVIHYARARSKNSLGISPNSSTKTVQLQALPVANLGTSITSNSFTANCTPNPSGSVVLFMDVSTDFNFGSFVGSYNNYYSGSPNVSVTGLNPGATYYYRFRQALISGTSANSNVMTVITAPATPVLGTTTDIDVSSFRANWAAVPTATSYSIQVSLNSSFSPLITNISPNPIVNITGTDRLIQATQAPAFTNNTPYWFRIRAHNGGGVSAWSTGISATTGSFTPVGSAASFINNNSFQANWGSVNGSSGYRIDVSTNSTFTAIIPGYSDLPVSGTFKEITGLTACTNYYYRIRSVTPSGLSKYSIPIGPVTTSIAAPLVPSVTSASEVQPTSFQANWSAAAMGCSPVDYRLDVATDLSFTTLVLSNVLASVPNYSVTGLTSGVTYYYRVRASNGSGTSGNSASMSVTTGNFAPVLLAPSFITNTSFTANWQTVAGATGYTIDVSLIPTFATKVSGYDNLSLSGTSQNVVGLAANTIYYYRVRSLTSSGYSQYISSSTLTAPAAPLNSTANGIGSNQFTANWQTVTGVTEYRLDVSTAIDFSSFVGIYNDLTVNTISHIVTGLNPSTTYYYRVRAANSSGSSPSSGSASLTTLPPSPTSSSATSITNTSFLANWSIVPGATSYRLDVSLNSSFSPILTAYNNLSVPSNSQTVSGLSSNTPYHYRVRAVHPSGPSSSSNTISTLTLPATPTANSGTSVTTTSFSASWSSSSVASYELEVSLNSSFTPLLASYNPAIVAATSRNVTGLTHSTTYYYRVRAVNTTGYSVYSNQITVTTNCAGCRTAPENNETPEETENQVFRVQPVLYPNSVESQLNIVPSKAMANDNNTRIKVYDLSGREFQVPFTQKEYEFEVDVSILKTGTYIIWISGDKSSYIMRFLKK